MNAMNYLTDYYNSLNVITVHSNEQLANYEIANKIISYLNITVPFSPNNHLRGYHLTSHLSPHDFLPIKQEINKKLQDLKDSFDLEDVTESWDVMAQDILESRVGGCYELSIAGFAYAVKELGVRNIEIIEIENGDHDFLLIGRNPNSNVEDPLTYEDDCIVCDPWIGRSYPGKEASSKLHAYERIATVNGRDIPVITPLIPGYHRLQSILSSRLHIPQSPPIRTLEHMKISYLLN